MPDLKPGLVIVVAGMGGVLVNLLILMLVVTGIGKEPGITRRDPSDVIKVGDTYFLYYTHVDHSKLSSERKRLQASGYVGTIWYATSKDKGHNWIEQGLALVETFEEPGNGRPDHPLFR